MKLSIAAELVYTFANATQVIACRREDLAAAALFTHERIVSVNLAGKSQPSTR